MDQHIGAVLLGLWLAMVVAGFACMPLTFGAARHPFKPLVRFWGGR